MLVQDPKFLDGDYPPLQAHKPYTLLMPQLILGVLNHSANILVLI